MWWTIWLTAALAQEDHRPINQNDVVSVHTQSTDIYVFEIPTCDRVRALFRDERPASVARSENLVISIHNASNQTCLYKGVSLAGFLDGTYTTSLRNPNGTGLFIPPKGDVSVRIKPAHPELPRGAVQLEIAPKRGIILLTGLAPDQVPATE